jgi:hypothetical protein
VLTYMLEHNKEHAHELGDLAHQLHHAGQSGAADLLDQAVKDLELGNGKLAEVLKLVEPPAEEEKA